MMSKNYDSFLEELAIRHFHRNAKRMEVVEEMVPRLPEYKSLRIFYWDQLYGGLKWTGGENLTKGRVILSTCPTIDGTAFEANMEAARHFTVIFGEYDQRMDAWAASTFGPTCVRCMGIEDVLRKQWAVQYRVYYINKLYYVVQEKMFHGRPEVVIATTLLSPCGHNEEDSESVGKQITKMLGEPFGSRGRII